MNFKKEGDEDRLEIWHRIHKNKRSNNTEVNGKSS